MHYAVNHIFDAPSISNPYFIFVQPRLREGKIVRLLFWLRPLAYGFFVVQNSKIYSDSYSGSSKASNAVPSPAPQHCRI
jgi:hypothetical protein